MTDFANARLIMIDNQLRAGGVSDHRVLDAVGEVPRELFVPEGRRALAYADVVHHLGADRYLGAPTVFARLLQLAEIDHTDTVLDVGAGTGYGTAVLAQIGSVVTGLEADAVLAERARQTLVHLGIGNAEIITGAFDRSSLGQRHFDAIIVEGALVTQPDWLFAHLSEGGRLVALVGGAGPAVAMVYVRAGHEVTARAEFNASLPPLVRAGASNSFTF